MKTTKMSEELVCVHRHRTFNLLKLGESTALHMRCSTISNSWTKHVSTFDSTPDNLCPKGLSQKVEKSTTWRMVWRSDLLSATRPLANEAESQSAVGLR